MKRALTAMVISAFAALPAFAQDQGQIQSVLDGAQKCIGCNLFQAEFGMQDLSGRNFENARLRQANRLFSRMGEALTKQDLTTIEEADIRASRVFKGEVEGHHPAQHGA